MVKETAALAGGATTSALRRRVRRAGRQAACPLALLGALLPLWGCDADDTGAPGAAVATGDEESQREADEVVRELLSTEGTGSGRRMLVRITVDWEPSSTSDWGGEPSPARVARCYEVTPDPHDEDGPGGVDADWRAVEAECET